MKKREIQEILNSVRLTEKEKAQMKSQLFFRANIGGYSRRRGIRSPFFFIMPTVPVAALAVVLLIVSSLARVALPGDGLYGFKRGVNEKVLGILAVSDEQKAKLETDLIARRYQEIEQVVRDSATSTQDTQKTQEIIKGLEEDIDKNHEKVTSIIEDISDAGDKEVALEISAELSQTISIHKDIIETAIAKSGQDSSVTDSALQIVAKAGENKAKVEEKTKEIVSSVVKEDDTDTEEQKVDKQKIFEGSIEKLETTIGEVRDLIEDQAQDINPEFVAQAENLLISANVRLEKCKAGLQPEVKGEDKAKAFLACTNGLNDAKGAYLILTATSGVVDNEAEEVADKIQETKDNDQGISATVVNSEGKEVEVKENTTTTNTKEVDTEEKDGEVLGDVIENTDTEEEVDIQISTQEKTQTSVR